MQDKVQEEIIADFEMFDDPDDRLQYLIDMADECRQIDERHKTEQYLIDGCQSRVWIDAELKDGKVYFSADADALIVKGIAGLLTRALGGRTPAEILQTELYFIDRIGIRSYLSPTRANGLSEMLNQMKRYALAFSVKE
ncbi:MAG: SufE family protein [Tidjanibacter sp.]|jgi:cysteine desulfuration protein SufE|nr:SufE family protein [Tidjanibacter sp.]MBQ1964555.1 SufE family protein [Tidjanibacter sp.]MBQ5806942.1 SufE family protein [Tidjanibacter sp.]MBQ5930785.1 SufE family protein [Tidjanibacter sp.]